MRTSFHYQPEAQHPNFPLSTGGRLPHLLARSGRIEASSCMSASLIGRLGSSAFRLSTNSSVDVAHGLALLFGLGTKALPSWDEVRSFVRLDLSSH